MVKRILQKLGLMKKPLPPAAVQEVVEVTAPAPTLQDRFTAVYQQNMWMDDESRSGPGSRRDSGSVLTTLETLETIVSEHNVQSINDIPCGDFNWMDQFLNKHPGLAYHGFDIVQDAVEGNRAKAPQFKFDVLNIVIEVPPQADLILCKDLLNHLTNDDVSNALENMAKSGSRFLLASNNFGWENEELAQDAGGMSRHLDIMAEPFNAHAPIWHSGYLGLWDLEKFR